MISKDKQYRTRDGREVRIYATDGAGDWPAHGAVLTELGWLAFRWRADGASTFSDSPYRDDLIEVKPRIKRTVWLNVLPEYDSSPTAKGYASKIDALAMAPSNRLACVKVEIDCEEGEGL
jgi:hypothetical protein